jgi:low temperature requirement protein LtrA
VRHDSVFVFAITQLTGLLAGDPTVAAPWSRRAGLRQPVVVYGGYAWRTNAVPPREPVLRVLMLLGMGGFLVVALAVPTAFDGVVFGVGYLLVTVVHSRFGRWPVRTCRSRTVRQPHG